MVCIIAGCRNRARHNFGVRLRRPRIWAIWAPNTEAYLCDEHAVQGLRVEVTLIPTDTGVVDTEVSSPRGGLVRRLVPLRTYDLVLSMLAAGECVGDYVPPGSDRSVLDVFLDGGEKAARLACS